MMTWSPILSILASSVSVLLVMVFLNTVANVLYLRRQRRFEGGIDQPEVAVLIPARNEEKNIVRLLDSLLEQDYPAASIHVYDDQSDDRTPEMLADYADLGVRIMRGEGPPPGWMGKVNALFMLTRDVQADIYLFLDADTQLMDKQALSRMIGRYQHMDADVATGVTHLEGGGAVLVSLVGSLILSAMPWWLGKHIPASSMAGVNGQCWLIKSATYRALEPHVHVRGQVLEDIHIGRYLHRNGIRPMLMDVQREVAVFMYSDLKDAWSGFRKNAYDIAGGSPIRALVGLFGYTMVCVVLPFVSPVLWLYLYAIKFTTDRFLGISPGISALAPVSYVLGAAVQVDSAWANWRGTNVWKGRILFR